MPNFKDTYSSQDNYNTRKSINFHSNRDLNDTESIGKKHGLNNYFILRNISHLKLMANVQPKM